MPPVRTGSMASAKPVKTERTHEENQERAYIAASRRSDRSLEARIESARRASEIHKKRTGRALRVTEEDVVNEEMYEEEDDDLPSQYRRLTAHLASNSVDFNRRLQAYMVAQVATRNAVLPQNYNQQYASQYPNAPQFAHYVMQQPVPTPMMPPHLANRTPSGANFRQAPYQVPHGQNREGSISVSSPSMNSPMMAIPPNAFQSPTQTRATVAADQQPTTSSCGTPNPIQPVFGGGLLQHSNLFGDMSSPFGMNSSSFDPASGYMSHASPLSHVVPNDTQQLMYGAQLDINHPYNAFAMHGSNFNPGFPSYSYNPNPSSKSRLAPQQPRDSSATLAPPPSIDTNLDGMPNFETPSSAATDSTMPTPYTPVFHPTFDGSNDFFKAEPMTRTNSNQLDGSGTLTPNVSNDSLFNDFVVSYDGQSYP